MKEISRKELTLVNGGMDMLPSLISSVIIGVPLGLICGGMMVNNPSSERIGPLMPLLCPSFFFMLFQLDSQDG